MPKTASPSRPIVCGIVAAALLFGLVNGQAIASPGPRPAAPAAPTAPTKTIYTDEEQQALALARKGKQPVAVASTTTETSQVVANPNGTFTLTSNRQAVRTKTSLGAWVPIDTRLTVSSDGRIRPAATTLDVSLSGGGTSAAISLRRNKTSADLTLPFTLPTPTLNGATATYSEVLPGVDLQLTAYPEHVTQVLVVKTAAAAQQPQLAALQLSIQTSGGSLSVAADGSSTITDTAGSTMFQAAPPTMWDSKPGRDGTPNARSSGDNDKTIRVAATTNTTRRAGVSDSKALTLSPDTATLTGTDVVYPLYIDPSFGIGRNNFLVVRSSGQNYWTNTDVLRVGYCAWSGCSPYAVARSYFDFNYAALAPRGGFVAQVTSAAVTVTQVSAASSAATPVNLSQAGGISSGLGWAGPLGAAIQTLNSSSGSGTLLRFDSSAVRDYTQQGANGGWPTITFALNSPNEADANQWKKFDNNPALNLTYTYPPAAPTNLTAGGTDCNGTTWVNTKNVTLQASVSDNGNGTGVWQDFDVYNVATGARVSSNTVQFPSGTNTATLALSLPNDGTYYFTTRSSVRPTDSAWAYGSYVQSGNFTVRTTTNRPTPPSVYSADFPQMLGSTYDLYGMTNEEALAQPATFTITATDPGTIAFSYSWNNDNPPSPTTCQATAPISSTQPIGFIRATNGTATITYPTLAQVTTPSVLYLRTITASNNVSDHAIYQIDPWTGSTTRVEATPSQFTTSMTKTIDTTNANQLSDGNQVQLTTTTAAAQTATHTITMPAGGQYSLAIEFSTTPNSGHITLAPATAPGTCTPNGYEARDVNLLSATAGKMALVYANEDPNTGAVGWTCPTGGGTIAYQITAPATSGSVIDIDYVRGLNDTDWTPPAWPSTLASGTTLQAGQQLAVVSSANDKYTLRLRTDCNLVLTKNGTITWSTGTANGDTQCRLTMQTDGNLILYSSTGITLWASNTSAFSGASLTLQQTDGNLAITRSVTSYMLWSTNTGYIANRLYKWQHLTPNDSLYTENHIYQLVMQGDCNLVVYQTGTAIWSSGTSGRGTGCHAEMQGDGNFVLYNSAGTALWWTGTSGLSISMVSLQTNGKFVLINTNGTTAWSS
jgi:hypothetical protein